MKELTPEQIQKLKKYEPLVKNKEIAFFDELKQINETLQTIASKDPVINIPETVVNVPEPVVNIPAPVVNMPAPVVEVNTEKVDMTKTNDLLQRLLDKEDKEMEITATLEII